MIVIIVGVCSIALVKILRLINRSNIFFGRIGGLLSSKERIPLFTSDAERHQVYPRSTEADECKIFSWFGLFGPAESYAKAEGSSLPLPLFILDLASQNSGGGFCLFM